MELHELLVDLVADGMAGDIRLYTVECKNGHVSGYAKVPVKEGPYPLSVMCSKCDEIANIWKALARSEPPRTTTKTPRKKVSAKKLTLPKQENHAPGVQAEKQTEAAQVADPEEGRSESQKKNQPTNTWRNLKKLEK